MTNHSTATHTLPTGTGVKVDPRHNVKYVELDWQNQTMLMFFENPTYRFGDALVGGYHTKKVTALHAALSKEKFRGTLIHSFLHAKGGPRFETISNECAKMANAGRSDETVYIYARMGDRKEGGFATKRVRETLECGTKLHGTNKAVIVAAMNFAGGSGVVEGNATAAFHPQAGEIRLGADALDRYRVDALERGYASVSLQSSLDPDIDFCTLVNAKHVVYSGAGLAKIVIAARLARAEPTTDPPDIQGTAHVLAVLLSLAAWCPQVTG